MLKGFMKKGQKVEGKVAPQSLQELSSTPQDDSLSMKPSVMTSQLKENLVKAEAIGEMFSFGVKKKAILPARPHIPERAALVRISL